MKNYLILLFSLVQIAILFGQETPRNSKILKQENVYYLRNSGFIFEVSKLKVKYFSFGWLADEVDRHDRSSFLNFDVKDSLIVTTEYVNRETNPSSFDPNRFYLVLKHPSLGNPMMQMDQARFDLKEYLPKDLGKFYYDISILDDNKINFFLLYNTKLAIYEINFNEGYAVIKSFKLVKEYCTKLNGYFNVIDNSITGKNYLFSNGNYYEFKRNKIKKKGSYDRGDFIVKETDRDLPSIVEGENVNSILESFRRSHGEKTISNGKYVIDNFIDVETFNKLSTTRKMKF